MGIAFFSKRVFDICLSSSTPWTWEKLKIRCRVHHLDLDDQIPKVDRWYLRAAEPVWEEERGALLDMNRAPPNMAQRKDKSFADEVERYEQWKKEREQRLG